MPRTIIAVAFGKGGKTYDYFWPFGEPEIGQRVKVPTSKGEGWTKARIMEVRAESVSAKLDAIDYVDDDVRTDEQRMAKHANGWPVYSRDGTIVDDKGDRSIFDDVDK